MAVVCPSSCPVPDPKSRTEGQRKLKIDRKEVHDGWSVTHLDVERSKVKVTRPLKAVTDNQPYMYLRNRKTYKLQTWYTDGVRWPALPTCAVTSKVKALGRCSSHHLQGRGHIVAAALQAPQLVIVWLDS